MKKTIIRRGKKVKTLRERLKVMVLANFFVWMQHNSCFKGPQLPKILKFL